MLETLINIPAPVEFIVRKNIYSCYSKIFINRLSEKLTFKISMGIFLLYGAKVNVQ